jgi:hypothetical protein
MKTTIKNSIHLLIVTLLVLPCFLLLSAAQGTDLGSVVPGANTADGSGVLVNRTTGVWNTGIGFQALYHDTSGNSNTATGLRALFSNTTGYDNTATGVYALFSNTDGNRNTATGRLALGKNISASFNTAYGYAALFSNTGPGHSNTAVGAYALLKNNTGNVINIGNTAIGSGALENSTNGAVNTALGYLAGSAVTQGDYNIDIGNAGAAADSYVTRIGDRQVTTFIAGIRGVTTANANAVPVVIDSAGQLGTMSSSRRYKHDVEPMDQSSEALLSLKPVTFHYKSDATNTPQFGLIAEEVVKVDPNLVVRDDQGEIYTVRYDAVNAMLLNEFLKEHRKVEEQSRKMQALQASFTQQQKESQANAFQQKQELESKIAHQQKQIEALTAGLQKVSTRVEAAKFAPQIVTNDQ